MDVGSRKRAPELWVRRGHTPPTNRLTPRRARGPPDGAGGRTNCHDQGLGGRDANRGRSAGQRARASPLTVALAAEAISPSSDHRALPAHKLELQRLIAEKTLVGAILRAALGVLGAYKYVNCCPSPWATHYEVEATTSHDPEGGRNRLDALKDIRRPAAPRGRWARGGLSLYVVPLWDAPQPRSNLFGVSLLSGIRSSLNSPFACAP